MEHLVRAAVEAAKANNVVVSIIIAGPTASAVEPLTKATQLQEPVKAGTPQLPASNDADYRQRLEHALNERDALAAKLQEAVKGAETSALQLDAELANFEKETAEIASKADLLIKAKDAEMEQLKQELAAEKAEKEKIIAEKASLEIDKSRQEAVVTTEKPVVKVAAAFEDLDISLLGFGDKLVTSLVKEGIKTTKQLREALLSGKLRSEHKLPDKNIHTIAERLLGLVSDSSDDKSKRERPTWLRTDCDHIGPAGLRGRSWVEVFHKAELRNKNLLENRVIYNQTREKIADYKEIPAKGAAGYQTYMELLAKEKTALENMKLRFVEVCAMVWTLGLDNSSRSEDLYNFLETAKLKDTIEAFMAEKTAQTTQQAKPESVTDKTSPSAA